MLRVQQIKSWNGLKGKVSAKSTLYAIGLESHHSSSICACFDDYMCLYRNYLYILGLYNVHVYRMRSMEGGGVGRWYRRVVECLQPAKSHSGSIRCLTCDGGDGRLPAQHSAARPQSNDTALPSDCDSSALLAGDISGCGEHTGQQQPPAMQAKALSRSGGQLGFSGQIAICRQQRVHAPSGAAAAVLLWRSARSGLQLRERLHDQVLRQRLDGARSRVEEIQARRRIGRGTRDCHDLQCRGSTWPWPSSTATTSPRSGACSGGSRWVGVPTTSSSSHCSGGVSRHHASTNAAAARWIA